MDHSILVAGGTGNLGQRIVRELLTLGAQVKVIVRAGSDEQVIHRLEKMGASIHRIPVWNLPELQKACTGVSCVVSSLAGLQEVIVDAQTILLDAAVAAGVPRFIPSDYSLDFTKFKEGENRNLDLRREFHSYLDKTPIASTTIFNGAFTDLLTGEMPLILFKQKMVLYWGKADDRWEFTTMDNTATYTAHAAMDTVTPRYLRIAGDQVSPRTIRTIVEEITNDKFRLFRAGGAGLLGVFIKLARTFSPGKNELYPAWQGMQYMHNMIDKRSKMISLDNDRYAGIEWTSIRKFLETHIKETALKK
jgi:nucleoside-diphosphate-sugar epimerase